MAVTIYFRLYYCQDNVNQRFDNFLSCKISNPQGKINLMNKFIFHKLLIAIILFNYLCSNTLAQNVIQQEIIDSLLKETNNTANNAEKARVFDKMSQIECVAKNYEKTIEYGNEALQNFAETENTTTRIVTLQRVADAYFQIQKHAFALKYYIRATNLAEKSGDSTTLASIYSEIGLIYFQIETYSKAIEYFDFALDVYKKQDNELQINKMTEMLALASTKNKEFYNALNYYSRILVYYKKSNSTILIIKTLRNIIEVAKQLEDYQLALEKNTEIYDTYQALDDYVGMAATLNNIGFNYVFLKQFDKAIETFNEVLRLDKKIKMSDDDRAKLFVNIGICYQNMGNSRNSLTSLNEAVLIREKQGNNQDLARIQNLIALVYYNKEDFYNADVTCLQSISTAQKSNDKDLLQLCYQTYSKILQEEKEYEKALIYYQLYLNIRDSLLVERRMKEQELTQKQLTFEKNEKELKLMLADEEMKELSLKQLRLESEKKEQEVKILIRDKELQESKFLQQQQALAITKQQHDAEIQQREIVQLQQERELQASRLKQKELEENQRKKTIELLEQQKQVQQLTIDKQNAGKRLFMSIGVLFSLIFILILLGFIMLKKRNKILNHQKLVIQVKNIDLEQKNEEINAQAENLQRANDEIQLFNAELRIKQEEILAQNEEITQQKDLIEAKNDSITASINYASRIQSAILPPIEIITNDVIESFVLFKPRDIVSGDFYWFREVQINTHTNYIVVAADCTGHGVPGALMSMLGVSFLNEITAHKEITQAGEILNELRERVKTQLRQTGQRNEPQDGMDIVLCVIDIEDKTLQFAGANNPLILIRNQEVILVKGDKMPIGIYLREKSSFTNHIVELQPNDTIYLCSDGYQDQFGGERADKFKLHRLKDLLLSIQNQPMHKQKEQLDQNLLDWQGTEYEQVDDILVVGLRFK